MPGLRTTPLDASTWPDSARLVEDHNGVWGGCWCMAFHPARGNRPCAVQDDRASKQERVRAGTAHAALVPDGDDCVGWCQFGPVAELPRIKHRRAYESAAGEPPDWRITCLFVAKTHRRAGVASAALDAAAASASTPGW